MSKIEIVLNDYFEAWGDAFKSKDEQLIRNFMSKKFWGYWAKSGMEDVMQYDYHYDLTAVLDQYDENTKQSFEADAIVERLAGREYLIVGTETSVIQDVPHRAKCMFVWREEEGGWKLLREYIELER